MLINLVFKYPVITTQLIYASGASDFALLDEPTIY